MIVDISIKATALERGAVKRPPCPAKSGRQGHEGVREWGARVTFHVNVMYQC